MKDGAYYVLDCFVHSGTHTSGKKSANSDKSRLSPGPPRPCETLGPLPSVVSRVSRLCLFPPSKDITPPDAPVCRRSHRGGTEPRRKGGKGVSVTEGGEVKEEHRLLSEEVGVPDTRL